jgi:hypothetical protein
MANHSTNDRLWVRTCYEPNIALAYAEIARDRLLYAYNACLLIYNKVLYDVGNDWTEILPSMPYIPDVDVYYSDPTIVRPEIDSEPPEDVDL